MARADTSKFFGHPVPQRNRALAIFNHAGVLVDRIDQPSDAQWDAAHESQRFPNGFDNDLGRYRIAEYSPGRWRFEPVEDVVCMSALSFLEATNPERHQAIVKAFERSETEGDFELLGYIIQKTKGQ